MTAATGTGLNRFMSDMAMVLRGGKEHRLLSVTKLSEIDICLQRKKEFLLPNEISLSILPDPALVRVKSLRGCVEFAGWGRETDPI